MVLCIICKAAQGGHFFVCGECANLWRLYEQDLIEQCGRCQSVCAVEDLQDVPTLHMRVCSKCMDAMEKESDGFWGPAANAQGPANVPEGTASREGVGDKQEGVDNKERVEVKQDEPAPDAMGAVTEEATGHELVATGAAPEDSTGHVEPANVEENKEDREDELANVQEIKERVEEKQAEPASDATGPATGHELEATGAVPEDTDSADSRESGSAMSFVTIGGECDGSDGASSIGSLPPRRRKKIRRCVQSGMPIMSCRTVYRS